ncbi:MAG: OmpA family protein [Rickettsiales bacterium]|nr:OmpA family protein [Rickettsiales bacterium]
MINLKKACMIASAFAVLAPAAVYSAPQLAKDIVTDKNGNQVVSSNGNCVVTKWDSSYDNCHGALLTKEQRTVYFDFNKSTLNAKEKAKLNEVAKIIKGAKEVESVDIVGFADKIGTSSYNQKLSTKRANAVKAYLATKGLKTRKVSVEGKGENTSVTKCDEKGDRAELIACLAADRRVEIKLNVKK